MADTPQREVPPEVLKAVQNYLRRQEYNRLWRQRTGYNRKRWLQEKEALKKARELGLL
jgi:hypothetical protein